MFVTAIEEALREGRVDLAVHSAKDLPTGQPDDLRIAACLPRADARDVLVSRRGGLQLLPSGSRVGTSSPSRSAQLLAARADLTIADVRGNVDTRLGKLAAGEYDALVLAAAGLVRLGLVEAVTEWLSLDVIVPAPGQGALAVQVRADDEAVGAAVASLDDAITTDALATERAFLAATGAGCTGVVGAYARVADSMVELTGLLARADGEIVRGRHIAPRAGAADLGRELAMGLLAGSHDAVTVTQHEAQRAGVTSADAFEAGALRGRRIIVTRSEGQASALVERLRVLGADVVACPAIAIRPPEQVAPLDEAIRNLTAIRLGCLHQCQRGGQRGGATPAVRRHSRSTRTR